MSRWKDRLCPTIIIRVITVKYKLPLHPDRIPDETRNGYVPYHKSITQQSWLIPAMLLMVIWQFLTPTFAAAPVKRHVLQALEISQDTQAKPKTITITIQLNYPFQYSRHFPNQVGDTIVIEVQPFSPVNVTEPEFIQRESLVAPDEIAWLLNDVTYEGDQGSSAKIWISFKHPVSYDVSQGRDFRSLNIKIRNDFPDRRIDTPRK